MTWQACQSYRQTTLIRAPDWSKQFQWVIPTWWIINTYTKNYLTSFMHSNIWLWWYFNNENLKERGSIILSYLYSHGTNTTVLLSGFMHSRWLCTYKTFYCLQSFWLHVFWTVQGNPLGCRKYMHTWNPTQVGAKPPTWGSNPGFSCWRLAYYETGRSQKALKTVWLVACSLGSDLACGYCYVKLGMLKMCSCQFPSCLPKNIQVLTWINFPKF